MLGKVLTVLALLFGIGLLGALELAATHHTWQAAAGVPWPAQLEWCRNVCLVP